MILGEDDHPRTAPTSRGHKGRTASEPDPSDREAFVLTVPERLRSEGNVVWTNWLAPPGLPSPLTGISGGFAGPPDPHATGSSRSDTRRSPLESPPPTEA